MRKPRFLLVLLCLTALSACQCGQPATQTKHKQKGEPCASDSECDTGLCEKVPGETQKKCINQCPCMANEVCTPLDLNRFGCVPEREGLCKTCSDTSPCPYPADLCITVGGAPVCGRDCSFDGTCPTGYKCDPAFDKNGNQLGVQCQPESKTCTCTAATIGQAMPCETANTFGTCMGTRTCALEGYSSCTAATPAAETCNGKDDDCNGTMDDGLGQSTCGVGECKRTVDNCFNGAPQTCKAGDAGVETCNEKDDDCNGVVDDGFNKTISITTCGTCTTVCSTANGTPNCVAGHCGIANCAAPFANCNALIPDGCETNTNTDLANCGACGAACGGAHATGSCANGICTLTCAAGYVDADGNPANGCEYSCTVLSATDLPDLGFVDANCDGIDGELANSIFVSAAGNDANPGTRAQPKATIQAGLNAAVAQSKRDVLVSIGNYSNQVVMPSNKGLYGGYAPATWVRANANIVNVNNVNTPLLIENVSNVTVQLLNFLGTTPSGSSATAYGAMVRLATGVTLEGLQIRAGNGTAGTSGGNGSTGGSGFGGSTGQAGCEDSGGFCSGCGQPQGGSGGTSVCGRTGGRGGNAGHGGGYGDPGGTGVGGTGTGGASIPPYWGNYAPFSPYIGNPGNNGVAGSNGASAASFGTLSAFGYVSALASGGIPGAHGDGGGGGGGGGGGDSNCDSYGGGGGGGGAGGCAGGGGGAGLSGGASIAVFIYSSTVNAKVVQLQTGNGGSGGNGGAAGGGGVGGPGAIASQGAGNEYGGGSEQDDGSNGGKGGKGGNGGSGGAGGAGAGGPVIGVVVAGGGTWTPDTATVITLGTAGTGGTSSAGAGATGLSQAVY